MGVQVCLLFRKGKKEKRRGIMKKGITIYLKNQINQKDPLSHHIHPQPHPHLVSVVY